MAGTNKADAATTELRVDQIYRLKVDGARTPDILQFVASAGWGLKERQVQNLIAKANQKVIADCDRRRRLLTSLAVARLESLYARALNAADFSGALRSLTELHKIQGLYASDKELKDLARMLTEQSEQLKKLEAEHAAGRTAIPLPEPKSAAGQADSQPS